MKKILLSIAVSLVAFLAVPLSASAAQAQTLITGNVTKDGNPANPAAGAKVTVICKNHFRTDKTNASGDYLVSFPAQLCPSGTPVHVFATKANLAGSSNGTVTGLNTKLNIAVVNVSLPEVGLITGAVAAVGGGGAFWAVRRRKVEQR